MRSAVLELQASLNAKGRSHAASLIKAGKVSQSKEWDGPSAGVENSYLEAHSFADYGKWFLGVDPDADPETKGHYKYPFTDDFKTVSLNGLRAIRTRAAQTGETEIFNAAGPLFDGAKKKLGLSSPVNLFEMRARLENVQEFRGVDVEAGTMSDVSILEEGEAKGHGVLITRKTLEGAAQALQGKSLPAYITHTNAQDDRLNTEVGFFSGFYLDGGCEHAPYSSDWCEDRRKTKIDPESDIAPEDRKQAKEDARAERAAKIQRAKEREEAGLKQTGPKRKYKLKARQFQAFNSFRNYQPEAFSRLFEMAEILPENFGVSLVFEARLFWQMSDDTELEFDGWDERPEGSQYELPTVEVVRVMSADFVDNPAANSSLFSEIKTTQKIMKTEFTTAASEELERQKIEAGEMEQAQKAKADASEPKKKKRKKLSIPVEVLEEDAEFTEPAEEAVGATADNAVIAELEGRLSERDQLIAKMSEQLQSHSEQIATLKELLAGEEPIAEDAADEEISEEQNTKALKEKAVKEVLELNETMTRSSALLEVGKKHPEYFNN
jgi:hypothetical protein